VRIETNLWPCFCKEKPSYYIVKKFPKNKWLVRESILRLRRLCLLEFTHESGKLYTGFTNCCFKIFLLFLSWCLRKQRKDTKKAVQRLSQGFPIVSFISVLQGSSPTHYLSRLRLEHRKAFYFFRKITRSKKAHSFEWALVFIDSLSVFQLITRSYFVTMCNMISKSKPINT
jgi:hypothetical protein